MSIFSGYLTASGRGGSDILPLSIWLIIVVLDRLESDDGDLTSMEPSDPRYKRALRSLRSTLKSISCPLVATWYSGNNDHTFTIRLNLLPRS